MAANPRVALRAALHVDLLLDHVQTGAAGIADGRVGETAVVVNIQDVHVVRLVEEIRRSGDKWRQIRGKICWVRSCGVHFSIVVQLLVAQFQLEIGRGDALGDGTSAGGVETTNALTSKKVYSFYKIFLNEQVPCVIEETLLPGVVWPYPPKTGDVLGLNKGFNMGELVPE